MKFIFIIFFIFFTSSIFAAEENNESLEVIKIHESKSFDQMVLDHFNNEEECYIFYRDQLCDYRWTEWYELDRNEIVKIFKEEWKLISS